MKYICSKWKIRRKETLFKNIEAFRRQVFWLELDWYIGNTHHRGRLWTIGTIGKWWQSVTSRADVSRWCYSVHLAMGSIGHPCRTIQGPARYLSLMTVQALREVSVCDGARPTTHAVLFKLWGGICLWSSCSSITLLDQLIECGNKTLLAISCHRYAIFNRQNDKKKT